jgi:nicotinamidase-related amidase
MKEALLVIDMQNIYLPGEKWECGTILSAIDYIDDMIGRFDSHNIFFTEFISPKEPVGVWKDYLDKYSDVAYDEYLNDYIDRFKKYLNKDNLFSKSTYSSMSNEDLKNRLEEYDTRYVTGVTCDCCVLATIYDLIDMGKKIIYCKKGISGYTKKEEQAVIDSLNGLSPLHVEFKED